MSEPFSSHRGVTVGVAHRLGERVAAEPEEWALW